MYPLLPTNTRLCAVCLCALLCTLAYPASASPDDTDTPPNALPDPPLDAPPLDPLTIDPVEVNGVLAPSSVKSDPEGGAWVNKLNLRSLSAVGESLADVLSHSPGLSIRASGGGLQPKELNIRGVGTRQVLVTIEGVRLNSVAGGGFDLSLLPEGLPGEIEVWRGAGEVLYGSGAQGGVVSLRLLQNIEDGKAGEARVGGGSWGAYRGWGWVGATPSPGVRVGAGVGVQGLDGDFLFIDAQGTEHRRRNNDGRQGSIWAVADWEDAGLRAVHLTSWTARGAPGPSEFPEQFREARLENGLSVTALRGAWGVLGAPRDGYGVEALGQASARVADQKYQNPTALLGGRGFGSDHRERALEAELGVRLWRVFGGDIMAEARVGGMVRDEALTREVGTARKDFGRVVGAGFVWAQVWWADVSAGVGGRWEGIEGEMVWVTRGAVSWSTLSWLEFKASAGQRFRLPTFDELYLRTEFVRGSENLRPEGGWQADGGVRVEPWPWLRLEVAAFRAQHDDLIQFVPASAVYYEARNLSGAQVWGVEVDGFWEVFGGLTLASTYSWTDARQVAEPHAPLPGRAAHVWDGRADWEVLGGLRLTAGGRYVGERFLDALGRKPQQGWWWVYGGALWRADTHWEVGTRIENILDIQDAADALQQPLPGISWQAWVLWRPLSE